MADDTADSSKEGVVRVTMAPAGRTAAPVGDAAVVIGASMAGLCAARVLADRFDKVVVLDRDTLPDGPQWRSQVPQGRQPHLLLLPGLRLLEGWFPGLTEDLLQAGAIEVDLCRDVYWHQSGGAYRRSESTLRCPAMSRPLLEWLVRSRLAAHDNVTVRRETTVEALEVDADTGDRVVAVRTTGGDLLPSDLVVDATGKQARSLALLAHLGYPPPETSVVEVGTRYVTQVYRRVVDPQRDWKFAALIDEPSTRRLAMAVPVEGDRWLVMLAGINGEAAPTDRADAIAYARSFPSPLIADLMESAEPIGEAVTHRFPANNRRHVERLRRFPLGWVPVGDSVCSFNPIYGQGMTSAAQQAHSLGAQLDRSGAIDRTFARRYFRAAGRIVSTPWSIAVGGDFAYPDTKGKKPFGTDVINRYLDRGNVAAQHDDRVALRMTEVLALVRRPESLLSPAFVARVLWAARRGPQGSRAVDPPGSDDTETATATATAEEN